MKQIIPAMEVSVCDICHRNNEYLDICPVCGREYCLYCEAIVYGCIHKMNVCYECGKDKDVMAVAEKFATMITEVLVKRNVALLNLRKDKNDSD